MPFHRRNKNHSIVRTGTPLVVAAVGDSITAGANEWHDKLELSCRATVNDDGVAGDELSEANRVGATSIEGRYAAAIVGVDWAIVQGGVNDLLNSGTIANMQSTASAILAASSGIRLGFMNIAPFSGYSSWTSAMETDRLAWNSWLETAAADNGVDFYDIASALADPADSSALLSTYDSGDGLHPNEAGAIRIARVVLEQHQYELDQDA